MKVNYLNLTSGLEWVPLMNGAPYKLVRIQSSHFEANAKWSAILDLDYSFLIDAATTGVVLHDCGSRNGSESRAQWIGVRWIKWAYAKANKGNLPYIYLRGNNATNEFENFYTFGEGDRIRKKAKQKLRYVGKLTGMKSLDIDTNSFVSTLDGQTEELAKLGGFRNI
jgi:hypothetical protein